MSAPPPQSTTTTLTAFTCPIGGKRMDDPVVATDGFSYDRRYMEAWLEVQSTSPITLLPLQSTTLLPNHALKSAILEVDDHGVTVDLVSFMGPITQDILVEPVVACDGHTYDRTSIQHWFRTRHTSPVTNAVLDNTALLPNHTLKKAIDEVWPKAASSRSLVSPVSIVSHDTITCDGCGMHPIVGPRYKSHTAKNFDVCGACEASGLYVAQEPFFKVLDSRLLGRPSTPVVPAAWPVINSLALPSQQPMPEPRASSNAPSYTICHTSVTCDGCFQFPIRGTRFKSSVAFDFDLCSACELSGRYAFCEPFLKVPDSRKLGRPATVELHHVVHSGDVLYRMRTPVAVCWTPNTRDVVLRMAGVDPVLPANALVLGSQLVRGEDDVAYVEVSGRLLGLPAQQVFVPQEVHVGRDRDVAVAQQRTMDQVKMTLQRRVFVTSRALPRRKWPSTRDSAVMPALAVRPHVEVATDAMVLDEHHQPFYRIANTNEWLCIVDDRDALFLVS
ncbi:hypothetical protein DYB28_010745 [Aphanomyces astaci]|uniref:U-box domain-containing protein n=2 Tax=Aphanomyces astaci TaxID=112090 RepID=A0A397E3K6_APHAT|nr:hypothetical protein DYB30_011935 [Aphanomyces astaci]RHZ29865.1 hypothetical protein DYB31_013017 [Aphanomyces astaci]RLO04599.1 hypothetical protein DYB28_010745 [Aphanomyces astaci]